MDHIEELSRALARFPGIGPRQAKRFVYFLLANPAGERATLAELITSLGKSVHQCPDCLRFYNGTTATVCNYCTDKARDDAQLMIVEKDQDLAAVERAGTYKGRYFVLGLEHHNVFGAVLGERLQDLGGRGDGVAGKKPATRGQRPFHHRFVALEQLHPALFEVFSQRRFS